MKKLSIMVAAALFLTACGSNPPPANQSADTNQGAAPSNASNAPATSGEKVALDVTGAGASFPQPIYVQWAQGFLGATGGKVNYQSIGSSGGVKQISAKTVDFGASDAPLKAEDLQAQGLVQFPTVIGGVVPVVNIAGVASGQLKLTGEVLAEIYLGTITQWNDPKIVELNPDVSLPNEKIITVFRADGSGTSFIFTNYLSQVSAKWQADVGAANTVKWPTAQSGTAGKGNEGVATYVNRIANSIGYVEYAYAKQNNMAAVQLKNQAGNFVSPSQETFAAAADVDWTSQPNFNLILTNQPAAQAWPLAAATFVLVQKTPTEADKTKAALTFFDWAYTNGDDAAKQLDYVPLPESLKTLVREEWKTIKDASGAAVYP